MRIAVLTSSYPRFQGDGTAPFVLSISEVLAHRGHLVHVIAPYDIAVNDSLKSPVKVIRFKYIWPKKLHIMGHARSLEADVRLRPVVILLLPLFLIASIINLIKECRRIDAQIIHAHWVLPNGFAAAIASKILKIPFVISLHGSDIFIADKNFIFRAVAKWTFAQSSFVTACSQELYDRAKKINSNIHIDLIPWGADPGKFKPLNNRLAAREKFDWAPDEIIISTLGRMVYKKGFSKLISIAPTLLALGEKIRIVIGGSGPLQTALEEEVTKMDLTETISLPGRIPWDEVPEFLAASDIFTLPSQRDKAGNLDGLPTVLLEAMACGLPCVVSDVGGVSLVIDPGKNGLLVPPASLEKLEEALSILIRDGKKRKTLSQAARKSVIESYNWVTVGEKFETLYEKSLNRKTQKVQCEL